MVGSSLFAYFLRDKVLGPKICHGGSHDHREPSRSGAAEPAVSIVPDLSQSRGGLLALVMHGDDAVGQYATAYRLMMVAAVITASLWNAYFPALARAHDSPALAILLSREYVGLLAWMGLPIAALRMAETQDPRELLETVAADPSAAEIHSFGVPLSSLTNARRVPSRERAGSVSFAAVLVSLAFAAVLSASTSEASLLML